MMIAGYKQPIERPANLSGTGGTQVMELNWFSTTSA
jgi:hypothetical protein